MTYKRYIKCGKKGCKTCREGKGHGPYMYKSVRGEKNGKDVKSNYLGKVIPKGNVKKVNDNI